MSYGDNFYLGDSPDFSSKGDPVCSQVDPEMFFPVDLDGSMRHNRERYIDERAAKKICFSCQYRVECFEYALKDTTMQGIWGGTTQLERRHMMNKVRIYKK